MAFSQDRQSAQALTVRTYIGILYLPYAFGVREDDCCQHLHESFCEEPAGGWTARAAQSQDG